MYNFLGSHWFYWFYMFSNWFYNWFYLVLLVLRACQQIANVPSSMRPDSLFTTQNGLLEVRPALRPRPQQDTAAAGSLKALRRTAPGCGLGLPAERVWNCS
jgi:hypothetical protein